MSDLAITQQDLEQVATLYDGIRAVYKTKNPQSDTSLHEAFERYIKVVMGELSQKAVDQPKSVINVLVMVTKFKLYQLCAQKLCNFVKMFSSDAAGLLSELFGRQEGLYTEVAQRLVACGSRVEQLEGDLTTARGETEEVLMAAETLEKNLAEVQADRIRLKEEVERLKTESVVQIQQLQDENKLFLEKIIKLSKQSADSAMTTPVLKLDRKDSKPAKAVAPAPAHLPPKDLTLRQLKELIEELYVAKPKLDQKCIETQQPRETMQQHMQRVLNKKYGLKSLVAEWHTNVIKAIQKFAVEDSEVAAFDRILRNDVEEEFRNTQKQTKASISDVLKAYAKSVNPYVQEKALKDWLSEKLNGELEDEEWDYVVSYMYSGEEAEYLKSVLTELMRARDSLSPRRYALFRLKRGRKEESGKSKISFGEFVKVVLDFQLDGHERFLRPFAERFKEIDTDGDGVLSEEEFKALLTSIGLGDESERLLELADPFETNTITFSDCVGLFSAVTDTQEQVEDSPDHPVSVLEKLHILSTAA